MQGFLLFSAFSLALIIPQIAQKANTLANFYLFSSHYLSPAADFQADGKKTGKYILAGEDFTLNVKGESVISYADYAIAMVDEIEKGNHIGQRISVVKE